VGDLPSGGTYLGTKELHLLSSSMCAARTVAAPVSIIASSIFLNRHQRGIIQSWSLSSVSEKGSNRSRQWKRWACTCMSLITRPSSKMAQPVYELSVHFREAQIQRDSFSALL